MTYIWMVHFMEWYDKTPYHMHSYIWKSKGECILFTELVLFKGTTELTFRRHDISEVLSYDKRVASNGVYWPLKWRGGQKTMF